MAWQERLAQATVSDICSVSSIAVQQGHLEGTGQARDTQQVRGVAERRMSLDIAGRYGALQEL